MNKKIKDIKGKELVDLSKILENCNIITFDPKDIKERVKIAYTIRTQAHKLLLRADVLLDGVIKELSGYENKNNN